MKVIPLSEAKARLSHYSRLCHSEPIVVTVKGVPAFQMVPLEADDDLTVLNFDRIQSRKKSIPVRQSPADSLLQSLRHRIAIPLSSEQPWKPVIVPLEVQTGDL